MKLHGLAVRHLGILSLGLAAVAGVGIRQSAAQNQGLPGARLYAIYPSGAKQGATIDVTCVGVDLDDASKLYFTDLGITAAPKTAPPGLGQTGPQPVAGEFTITVKPEVKPGLYEVRAIGKYGISNPRSFIVSTQPEISETEPNNTPKEATEVPLGSVVNGRSDKATDQDYYKFSAKAGQRIIIDCWAYRIDSRMDATLILFNGAGEELARNRDTNRRDPMLDFTAKADGDYFVEIHDFLYGGSNEYVYRLSIGPTPYLDFVFPPAGLPGSNGQYTLYGRNLPGSQPAKNLAVDGRPLEMLTVPIQLPPDAAALDLATAAMVEPGESSVDAVEYRLTTPAGATNPLLVSVATAPVVVEQEPNDDPAKAPLLTVPCEYVGQFYPRGDQDWVSFQAKKGEVLWIEVMSQRLGLPTDPFLLVQQVTKDDKGEEKVTDLQGTDDVTVNAGGLYFDTTTDDPVYRFSAPADGLYRVLVRDLYSTSRGDPRYVYRLAIRPAKPDFRLVAVPRFPPSNADANQNLLAVWCPLLRKGGSDVIDVTVFRRDGFEDDIEVSVTGLPAGVTAKPIILGGTQVHGTIVLTAADTAAEGFGIVQVVGKAKVAGAELVRTARAGSMVWPGVQQQAAPRSRLARNLAVAVSGSETAACNIDAATALVEMCRGGSVKVPLKVTRRGDFKGALAMTAIGLPQNVQPKNMSIDAAKAEAEFEITLPNNAPVGTYSFLLQGMTQVSYARNPEAAAAAMERKKAVDKIVTDLAAATKAANDAKAAADKAATDMKAAAQKALDAQKAADKAVADTTAAATAAATAAKTATEAASKDAANQALATAKQAADKAAEDAAAKAKAAADAKAVADKAAADAEAASKAAADAKVAADKAAADADAQSKQAAAFQQSFNQVVTDLANKSKPQNINVGFPSTPVTLKVTAAPVTMTAAAPAAALKQGMKVEIPVTIARLYNFADVVTLKAAAPGVSGLNIPAAMVAAGQTQAPLVLEATKDATPGTHKITITGSAKFNGQDLPVTHEIMLTIEKVEPAK